MTDLDERIKDQLKSDLTSLIRTARHYGVDAEETKDYFHQALQRYEPNNGKEDFQILGATVLLFIDGESPEKSLYQRVKEKLSKR